MVSEFKRRRDRAVAELKSAGVDVLEPAGAFYLFIRVGDVSSVEPDPGTRFAHRLLEEFEVAVVPGAAFGAPEWIRLSYAAPIEDVLEGVRRVVRAGIS
jgi:aspartate aminotransferase